MWKDANTPQIQSIRIPAGRYRGIIGQSTVRVAFTGQAQCLKSFIVQFKEGALKIARQFRAACSMPIIMRVVPAACVVKQREQANHLLVGPGRFRQQQPDPLNLKPMPQSMNGIGLAPVLFQNRLLQSLVVWRHLPIQSLRAKSLILQEEALRAIALIVVAAGMENLKQPLLHHLVVDQRAASGIVPKEPVAHEANDVVAFE